MTRLEGTHSAVPAPRFIEKTHASWGELSFVPESHCERLTKSGPMYKKGCKKGFLDIDVNTLKLKLTVCPLTSY